MNEDQEKPITLDDFIEFTKDMDGAEYATFMGLPLKDRVEVVKEFLKKK